MKITVKQLKSLIKEAIEDADNNALKQRFFQELSAARDAVATEDEELYIGDVDILSEYVSSDLMDQLMSEYSDEEIMMMYAEWEGSPTI